MILVSLYQWCCIMCLYHFYLPQTYRSCLKEHQNQHSYLNSFRMFVLIFWSQLSFFKFFNCRVTNCGKHNQPLFHCMLNCSMLNLLSNVFVAFLNQKGRINCILTYWTFAFLPYCLIQLWDIKRTVIHWMVSFKVKFPRSGFFLHSLYFSSMATLLLFGWTDLKLVDVFSVLCLKSLNC